MIEITRYDNAYPGANGARLVLSGSYEWANAWLNSIATLLGNLRGKAGA